MFLDFTYFRFESPEQLALQYPKVSQGFHMSSVQNVQQHACFFRAFGTNVSPGVEFVHLQAIPQDFGFSVNGCHQPYPLLTL